MLSSLNCIKTPSLSGQGQIVARCLMTHHYTKLMSQTPFWLDQVSLDDIRWRLIRTRTLHLPLMVVLILYVLHPECVSWRSLRVRTWLGSFGRLASKIMALLSACFLLLGSLRLGSRNGNGATHCPLLSRQNSLSIMARNSLSSTDSPGLSSSWDVWKMCCPIGPFLCGCLKIASPCICLGRSSLTMILFGQGVDKVDLPSYITATVFATTTSGLLVLPRQTSPTIIHPSLSFWWSIRRSNALLNYVMCITKVTSNQEKNVNWMSWTVTSEGLFSGEIVSSSLPRGHLQLLVVLTFWCSEVGKDCRVCCSAVCPDHSSCPVDQMIYSHSMLLGSWNVH